MNKKKIIFLAILGFFVFIVLIIAFAMSGSKTQDNTKTTAKDFKIWILNDSVDDFNGFIEDFKAATGNSNFTATVESFNNYDEYNSALASAIIKGEAPDLYMLNNNEKSIFLENAIGIDPQIISPDDMRTYFKPFFGDDLILSSGEGEQKSEFLVGVPFGFETLGLYFNLRRVSDVKKISSFPKIENFIGEFHDNKPGLTALGIGRGTTVENSADIITQFFMSDGVNNIENVNSSNLKNVFSEYFNYASGNNNYAKFDNILKQSSKTNLDYFIKGDIAMIFGYPRMLLNIDEKGFSKAMLRATNFPDFINESDKLANYNYFVLNKDSQNKEVASQFLKYIFSEEGEKAYLSHFKYYLPARVSVYSELKDRQIVDGFYVKLKDFYNQEAVYSSFDKGLKSIYDREVITLLDDEVNYLEKTLNFMAQLKCKADKVIKLENLSKNCE